MNTSMNKLIVAAGKGIYCIDENNKGNVTLVKERPQVVKALAFCNGKLYDGGDYGCQTTEGSHGSYVDYANGFSSILETITDQEIAQIRTGLSNEQVRFIDMTIENTRTHELILGVSLDFHEGKIIEVKTDLTEPQIFRVSKTVEEEGIINTEGIECIEYHNGEIYIGGPYPTHRQWRVFELSTGSTVDSGFGFHTLLSVHGKLYSGGGAGFGAGCVTVYSLTQQRIAQRESFVDALVYHKGRLLDAINYHQHAEEKRGGVIFDTFNDPLGERPLYQFDKPIQDMVSVPSSILEK